MNAGRPPAWRRLAAPIVIAGGALALAACGGADQPFQPGSGCGYFRPCPEPPRSPLSIAGHWSYSASGSGWIGVDSIAVCESPWSPLELVETSRSPERVELGGIYRSRLICTFGENVLYDDSISGTITGGMDLGTSLWFDRGPLAWRNDGTVNVPERTEMDGRTRLYLPLAMTSLDRPDTIEILGRWSAWRDPP